MLSMVVEDKKRIPRIETNGNAGSIRQKTDEE
jgi:hypothetical protein